MNMQVESADIRRMAIMWTDIVYLQVSRLEEAVDDFHAAATEEQFRTAFAERGSPEEWAEYASTLSRSLSQRDVSRVAADKYFLLLSVAQVMKCARRLPEDDLPGFPEGELLALLRNFEEHWEDPAGRSATELRKTIPDITPGRIAYVKDHIWLECVCLADILRWVEDVDRRIRAKA
jgi:hypothetical protein